MGGGACHEKLPKINLEFRHPKLWHPLKKKCTLFFHFLNGFGQLTSRSVQIRGVFLFFEFFSEGSGATIWQLSKFALPKTILKINIGVTPEKQKGNNFFYKNSTAIESYDHKLHIAGEFFEKNRKLFFFMLDRKNFFSNCSGF